MIILCRSFFLLLSFLLLSRYPFRFIDFLYELLKNTYNGEVGMYTQLLECVL